MRYVLGIDIGGTNSYAAIARFQDRMWTPPELVRLGRDSLSMPSALAVPPHGPITIADVTAGDEIYLRRIVRGFSQRIGDDVPMILGGTPYAPQILTAIVTRWIVDRVRRQEGSLPERVIVSHPGSWGPYRRGLLHRALWEAGLDTVTLVPEPVAAAESYEATGTLAAAQHLATYALGGSRCEVSVLRRSAYEDGFELMGAYEPAESVAGSDCDDLLVMDVRARCGIDQALTRDPRLRRLVADLRVACARAKEALSSAPQVTIPVPLSPRTAQVTVTRAEWEELLRPALLPTVDALLHAIAACRLRPHEIHRVLLLGGATRIPLIAQLLEEHFPGRVAHAPDPRGIAAVGAAVAGCRIASHHIGAGSASPRPAPAAARLVPPPRPAPPDHSDGDRGDGPTLGPPPRPPVVVTPLTLPKTRYRPRSGRTATAHRAPGRRHRVTEAR